MTGFVTSGAATRIPVRNLWLLMLYASRLHQDARSLQKAGVEDNPEQLFDLVSEVLVAAVERRLQRGLNRDYRPHQAVLNRVRGRIDTLTTETKMLLAQGRVACRFDRLTVDNPRNRLVCSALQHAAKRAESPQLRRRAQALAVTLARYGVTPQPVTARAAAKLVTGRNDRDDAVSTDAARLLLEMAIPLEGAGSRWTRSPDREAEIIRRLFERAVRGFYQTVLRPEWMVSDGERRHPWPVAAATPGLAAILPIMRTDIELERAGRRIIVETKFATPLKPGQFGALMLDRDHIFQLYAYVQSQHDNDDVASRAEGVLLYPVVDRYLDESATIQGHRYRIMTVDLAATAGDIRRRLLDVISEGQVASVSCWA
jgi:5-methylcytosine-specific restriction enzyme subunit McrC